MTAVFVSYARSDKGRKDAGEPCRGGSQFGSASGWSALSSVARARKRAGRREYGAVPSTCRRLSRKFSDRTNRLSSFAETSKSCRALQKSSTFSGGRQAR